VFDGDLDGLHDRSVEAGVCEVLVVGSNLTTSRRAVEVAAQFEGWGAAVGVHPHECDCWGRQVELELRALANDPNVRAIGEVGLDFHREFHSKDYQKRAFADQCDLAMELDLPAVVHSRDALDAVADLLQGLSGIRGVMHSYTGDTARAMMFVDLGMHISFSGIVTFRREEPLRATAAAVPLERLLVETDAPYLSPVPLRGRRNEPAYLVHTAAVVASARGMSVPSLMGRTTRNARAVFGANATNI
jgi:TatD DNase family protein